MVEIVNFMLPYDPTDVEALDETHATMTVDRLLAIMAALALASAIALIVLVLGGHVRAHAEVASAEPDIILRAPPPASDDHDCFVSVDNKALPCDLALYQSYGKRVRIQFNNDDSGRMVIFEGKKTKTTVVTIDAVTVGDVEGQPKKVKTTKATGLCAPYVGEVVVRCQAQTVNGNLFTASVEQRTRQ